MAEECAAGGAVMAVEAYFFAGGGTGGHIYPAIAVAEQILKTRPDARIHFFCSERDIDAQILSAAGFSSTSLPAEGLVFRPGKLVGFFRSLAQSYRIAREMLAETPEAVVVGVGGYVAAPVCWAGHRLGLPVALLNTDAVPGRANKVIGRFADTVFLQFESTRRYFERCRCRVEVVGCPLRSSFAKPMANKVIEELRLDSGKRILLVTGASSGAQSVNEAVCSLLERLGGYCDSWQIVHLTGRGNLEDVQKRYGGAEIRYTVLGYYDDMADLLAAADLVVGRSGAVSVAEYASAGVASICMPYPYHKDMHQYHNAARLVEVGGAVIVDDLPDAAERADWLWEELKDLMEDDSKREEMAANCGKLGVSDAAGVIAERLRGTS